MTELALPFDEDSFSSLTITWHFALFGVAGFLKSECDLNLESNAKMPISTPIPMITIFKLILISITDYYKKKRKSEIEHRGILSLVDTIIKRKFIRHVLWNDHLLIQSTSSVSVKLETGNNSVFWPVVPVMRTCCGIKKFLRSVRFQLTYCAPLGVCIYQ